MNALQSLPIRLVEITPQRALQAAEVKSKYKLYYIDSLPRHWRSRTRPL